MKSLSPFFLVCFHLSVCMHGGGEKPGVFSMNLLHVHRETACILHSVVDLYHLWHLCCIWDSLQSFITESTCMYSTTALWGGRQFITNWKVLTMPEVTGVKHTSKPKMQRTPTWSYGPRTKEFFSSSGGWGTGCYPHSQAVTQTLHICSLDSQPVFQKGICQADKPEKCGNFLTTGICIWLTLWGRQILCLGPGADSSEDKLLWDGQEWEEPSLHHLLSMYWAWRWAKAAGYALSEGKCRSKDTSRHRA